MKKQRISIQIIHHGRMFDYQAEDTIESFRKLIKQVKTNSDANQVLALSEDRVVTLISQDVLRNSIITIEDITEDEKENEPS